MFSSCRIGVVREVLADHEDRSAPHSSPVPHGCHSSIRAVGRNREGATPERRVCTPHSEWPYLSLQHGLSPSEGRQERVEETRRRTRAVVGDEGIRVGGFVHLPVLIISFYIAEELYFCVLTGSGDDRSSLADNLQRGITSNQFMLLKQLTLDVDWRFNFDCQNGEDYCGECQRGKRNVCCCERGYALLASPLAFRPSLLASHFSLLASHLFCF